MDRSMFSDPLDLKQIQVTDEFWHREQELVRQEVIPYQWEALNDRVPGAAPSYCMHNFRAAGRMMREKKEKGSSYEAPSYTFRGFQALPEDPAHPREDRFYGFVFQDTDFSKWIEAVGYSLIQHPDPELEKTADEAIDIVCAAQLENGYLDTYYIINGMDRAFTNLKDHHELYCLGHLVEGAVSYYQATGKDKLLRAAMGFADYCASYFGPGEGQCKGYPGHEIAEMALVRLYQVTGEERYLKLSRFFLDQRGQQPYYFDLEEEERARHDGTPYRNRPEENKYAYYQAHKPVREQDEALGHSVRAAYLYSGMADVARLTGDEAMLAACRRLWDSITRQKLYITGGIGATHLGEAFSFPYDLPNDTAYSETCAAIGLVFFARRMLQAEPEGRYGDVMELALYNTVLAGMALDGRSFFYVNPLEVLPEACRQDGRKAHVKSVRQKWFGCACCPPNIARTLSSVAAYAYTESRDTLWVHLYMGSVLSKQVGEKTLDIRVESELPWEGKVKMELRGDQVPCRLALRMPGWSGRVRISCVCAGKTYEASWEKGKLRGTLPEGSQGVEKGYLYLAGCWQEGDRICLEMDMEVKLVSASPKVWEDVGRLAVTRGPIVYCLEEADNCRDLHLCRLDLEKIEKQGKQVQETRELGHRMMTVTLPGMRLVPGRGESLYRELSGEDWQEVSLRFIPYYAWNNRGEGEMRVWVGR